MRGAIKISDPAIITLKSSIAYLAPFGMVQGFSTGDVAPPLNTDLDETGVFQDDTISETMGEAHQKPF
ncbi:MAG: hypothetical protein V3S06_03160 [candidate division Zixibacteria bacterium]